MPVALKDNHTFAFEVEEAAIQAPNLNNPQPLLDGDLTLYPDAFAPGIALQLYQQLQREIAWRQETLTLYGKQHRCPRLQCWIGNPEASYRYSGKTFHPEPWSTTTAALNEIIRDSLGQPFNSVLANLYRDGQDSMGWHSDNEAELGPMAVIASLSLGATRDFSLRRIGETRQHLSIALPSGSLLVMNAGMQQRWQHALPKRRTINSPRINLTFRQIIAKTPSPGGT